MAKEPDQTKWVGIRPTDPSEDIPTTTKKLAPAVGDLQAIKDNYSELAYKANANCSVSYPLPLPAVPDGEIWVVTTLTMVNNTTICDMQFQAVINGVSCPLDTGYAIEVDNIISWNGIVVLKKDDYVRGGYFLGGVADTLTVWAQGYKTGVY
jgi:hypothetical protein